MNRKANHTGPLIDDQGPIPTFPPRQLDAQGRLIPLSAAEERARRSAALRMLAALDTIGDEADHTAALKAIRAGLARRRSRRRPQSS